MRAACVFLILCGMLGCGKSQLLPTHAIERGTRALVLDLSVSDSEGSKDHPLTIQASVRNAGTAGVYRLEGGGPCQNMKIDILDSDGQPFVYFNPCGPVGIGLCAPPSPFEPGASQTISLPFTGVTSRRPATDPNGCELVDAPTGTYTVTVGFLVHWNQTDPPEPLQRRVTFHWTSP